ncbi:DUF5677 domain-containing protein [Pseudoalteromonas spongiae]|uniref:DUF5677 domain-containing protein n=1 Tax=Pseudoalteromonas spongiae TaxID=298657 RepID=UPI00110B2D96|nr:DUF5677 domain-containing protein [Pseudoalteromonas spongiae]TMO84681.1 hypothetical protein CWC15_10375 [Pseudoalteromonas spongiae]
MISEYLQIWNKFSAEKERFISASQNGEGRFWEATERDGFLLLLFVRINSLCDEFMFLVENRRLVSAPIVLRSILEAWLDFHCLLDDASYINDIIGSEAKELKKLYQSYSHNKNSPYFQHLNAEFCAEMLSKINEYSWGNNLNIYEKFKKYDLIDGKQSEGAYRAVYGRLCMDAHGNLSALKLNHLKDNGQAISIKEHSESYLKFLITTAARAGIQSFISLLEDKNYETDYYVTVRDSFV